MVGERTKDKIFNFRPLFFAAVALSAGIVFSYFRILYGISLLWLLGLLFLAVPFLFCSKKNFVKTFLAVALLLISFFIGAFTFSYQVRTYANDTRGGAQTYVVGRVCDKREYGAQTKVILGGLYIGQTQESGKLVAYLPTPFCDEVQISDELLLHGKVEMDVEYFDEYGFRENAIGENIRFKISNVKQYEIVGHKFNLFAEIRARLTESVYAGMDETPATVTIAILTGNTDGIDEGLLENVRYGGIAHIFAVSGLHVGALYSFCLLILKKTPLRALPKGVKFLLLSALLLFYGGICGFSASILRAIVLCLVSYVATLMLIKVDALDTLGVAAWLVLLLDPTSLFGAGFQLSFAACLGIVLMRRPIAEALTAGRMKIRGLFPKNKRMLERECACPDGDTLPKTMSEQLLDGAVSYVAVSTAAQMFTAPVLLYHFGYLSGLSMLLNLVFVPIISAGFAFLMAFVFVSCLLPTAWSSGILYIPNVLCSALLLLFECVDFSAFILSGIRQTAGSMLCYYGGCTFLTDKWNVRVFWKKTFAAVCFLGAAMILILVNIV